MATDVATQSSAMAAMAAMAAAGLYEWKAKRPILQHSARLFLGDQANQRMTTDWPIERERLRGEAEAVFDSFIEDGRPPYGLFKGTFGRTGFSQLSILAPRPGLRLFGAFVIDDTCFVGLRIYHRDELPFKATKQAGVITYKQLGQELTAEWALTLPSVSRLALKDL